MRRPRLLVLLLRRARLPQQLLPVDHGPRPRRRDVRRVVERVHGSVFNNKNIKSIMVIVSISSNNNNTAIRYYDNGIALQYVFF